MPNPLREKNTIDLRITMAGLARVHDRYLKGCKAAIVVGDSLEKDFRWLAEIERILIGSGFMTSQEIRERHQRADPHWLPEHDISDDKATFSR